MEILAKDIFADIRAHGVPLATMASYSLRGSASPVALLHFSRDGAEIKRRLAHPERFAGRGQGIQLAARARRSDLFGDAPLLAKDNSTLDPASRRRHVDTAGGEEGQLNRAAR